MRMFWIGVASREHVLRAPDAAELDTKARLGAAINRIVERRGLYQAEVATALEINQPKVSALLHYKLEGFSVERLMRFLVSWSLLGRTSRS